MSYQYLLGLIALSVYIDTINSLVPAEWLKVVPLPIRDHEELQNIYRNVREKYKKNTNIPRATDQPDIRKRICRNIVTSGSFHNYVAPLNMDKWFRPWKLLVERPTLLKHLMDSKMPTTVKTPFTYPTETQTFDLDGEAIEEKVFVCLSRCIRDHSIVDLYISEEYDVNLTSDDYVAGRFILTRDDSGHKYILRYLAEEPAVILEDELQEIQNIYLESRKDMKIAETETEDPICGLKALARSQVCSSVLSSVQFKEAVKYVPNKRREPECKLREGRHKVSQMEITEWMLTCEATPETGAGTEVMYYVGRGDKPENVFVYVEDPVEKYIHLLNISTKVRNVYEKNKEENTTSDSISSQLVDIADREDNHSARLARSVFKEEGSSSSIIAAA